MVAALFPAWALAVSIGASSIHPDEYCPNPSAASLTALFVPCQTFDSAIGNAVSNQKALQMGLLT
jgi:hypothetical protein